MCSRPQRDQRTRLLADYSSIGLFGERRRLRLLEAVMDALRGERGRRRRRSAAPLPSVAAARSPRPAAGTGMSKQTNAPRPTGAATPRSPSWRRGVRPGPDAVGRGIRLFTRVAPVHAGQLHALARGLLHRLGQCLHLCPVSLGVGRNSQGEQVPQSIDSRVGLRAFLALGPVVAVTVPALGSGAQGVRLFSTARSNLHPSS